MILRHGGKLPIKVTAARKRLKPPYEGAEKGKQTTKKETG